MEYNGGVIGILGAITYLAVSFGIVFFASWMLLNWDYGFEERKYQIDTAYSWHYMDVS